MKKILFLIIYIVSGILPAFSQSGTWSGELNVQGAKLPLVFHLDEVNPSVDSPAQNARGIPAQIIRTNPDSISVIIPSIGAAFSGKCVDNEITGEFTQRGFRFPLRLIPGEYKSSRPQTPRPPFPYSEEAVSFSNGEAVLKGTLTLPEGYNRDTPALIMITGSGLQNRDEEVFDHKPFAVIADALARNGIATLRYDDRGFGESSGDTANFTTEDLMYDALSGISLLRQRFNKVGTLGHSEGGTVSLMLGADKKVDFIISLAAMVISGKETLIDQNRYVLSNAGMPQQIVDKYCELLPLAFNGDENLKSKIEKSGLPKELKLNLQQVIQQVKSPYMKYFIGLDPRYIIGDVSCPVLALNGKKDTQIFYEKNLESLKNYLPENPLNRIYALDDMNHLFQHCQTGSSTEYATIEETISPEVLEIITQWVKSL